MLADRPAALATCTSSDLCSSNHRTQCIRSRSSCIHTRALSLSVETEDMNLADRYTGPTTLGDRYRID